MFFLIGVWANSSNYGLTSISVNSRLKESVSRLFYYFFLILLFLSLFIIDPFISFIIVYLSFATADFCFTLVFCSSWLLVSPDIFLLIIAELRGPEGLLERSPIRIEIGKPRRELKHFSTFASEAYLLDPHQKATNKRNFELLRIHCVASYVLITCKSRVQVVVRPRELRNSVLLLKFNYTVVSTATWHVLFQ